MKEGGGKKMGAIFFFFDCFLQNTLTVSHLTDLLCCYRISFSMYFIPFSPSLCHSSTWSWTTMWVVICWHCSVSLRTDCQRRWPNSTWLRWCWPLTLFTNYTMCTGEGVCALLRVKVCVCNYFLRNKKNRLSNKFWWWIFSVFTFSLLHGQFSSCGEPLQLKENTVNENSTVCVDRFVFSHHYS